MKSLITTMGSLRSAGCRGDILCDIENPFSANEAGSVFLVAEVGRFPYFFMPTDYVLQ